MSLSFKTRGIVIKAKDFKDADRIYTVYTKDRGKLFLRAQAVKKINSKMAAHLEPIIETDLYIAEAKGYKKIAGAQTTACFLNIKTDIFKLNLVLYCLDIFNSFVHENEKDTELYVFLRDFLKWCNDHKITQLTAKAYILKLLELMGYYSFENSGGNRAKVIYFLLHESWQNIQKLRLTPEIWQEISADIDYTLKTHLNRDLQTEKFLL